MYPNNFNNYCNFSTSLESYFNTSIGSQSIDVPKTFKNLESISRSSELNIKYRTIPVDSCIEYVAHEKIILKDGFTAEEGSHFVAYIDECEKCEEENIGERYNNEYEKQQETSPLTTSLDIEKEMYIIPNPNNGSFFVSLSNTEEKIIGIRVMDIMGKTVYIDNKFAGGDVVLPNVKQGLYYVTVVLKNGAITEKIVIK